jgi:Fur family transcriptional regulator, ferric uptake regulator
VATSVSSNAQQLNPRFADLAQRLRAIGQRPTPQRLLILAAFDNSFEHMTADEIFARVSTASPAVNRSTVYRTLELFRDLSVITETDLGGGVRHYQLLVQERHHHLVCHTCGAIVELDDDVLEPVRQEALRRYGFVAEIDHLAVFGRCRACADAI